MPPMFPLRTRRTATRQLTANEAFCKAQLETEQLLARIQQLQAAAFGADENTDRHWGDVGSLTHFNGLLREALEHYGTKA